MIKGFALLALVSLVSAQTFKCTSNATSDSCKPWECCGNLEKNGALVAAAANVCFPIDSRDLKFVVGADTWSWKCWKDPKTMGRVTFEPCVNGQCSAPGTCCAGIQ